MLNNNKVMVQVNMDTFTVLLAGMYSHYAQTRIEGIPLSLFFELAEKLYPYMSQWDYERISLEEWVKTMLLILPKVMIPEEDLNYMKTNNEIYMERWNGNVKLVCSAPVVVVK